MMPTKQIIVPELKRFQSDYYTALDFILRNYLKELLNYDSNLFNQDILEFIKQAQERVLSHQEDQALLKAYIAEWRKFFTQCSYLPMPSRCS